MELWIQRSKTILSISMLIAFFWILTFPIEKLMNEETGTSVDFIEDGILLPSFTLCPRFVTNGFKVVKGMNLSMDNYMALVNDSSLNDIIILAGYYEGPNYQVNSSMKTATTEALRQYRYLEDSAYLKPGETEFSLFPCLTLGLVSKEITRPNLVVIKFMMNTTYVTEVLMEIHDRHQSLHNSHFRLDLFESLVRGFRHDIVVTMTTEVKVKTRKRYCNEANSFNFTECVNDFYLIKMGCNIPWLLRPIDGQKNCSSKDDIDKYIDLMARFGNQEEEIMKEFSAMECSRPNCKKKSWPKHKHVQTWLNNETITEVKVLLYSTGKNTLINEVLLYGPSNFVADFGGYLGLLLGASIISLYEELLRLAYSLMKKLCKHA